MMYHVFFFYAAIMTSHKTLAELSVIDGQFVWLQVAKSVRVVSRD